MYVVISADLYFILKSVATPLFLTFHTKTLGIIILSLTPQLQLV